MNFNEIKLCVLTEYTFVYIECPCKLRHIKPCEKTAGAIKTHQNLSVAIPVVHPSDHQIRPSHITPLVKA